MIIQFRALALALLGVSGLSAQIVAPGIAADLVCCYDFEHPLPGDANRESDLGSSQTPLNLINGGAAMRVADGAFPASTKSLQTKQVNPAITGNDDWKAGLYAANGVPSLAEFSGVRGITLMGWIKPTGNHPAPNSTTADPSDVYNAVGLFGLLTGNSDGHGVRALVEIISFSGTLKLVALGRRIDGGTSLTLAATQPWQTILPINTWTHIAATFDFDAGTMALYRNGTPLAATTPPVDEWGVIGSPEPDLTSPTAPAGIKIGGSFPQNTQERNAFNGRLDDLMFFKRSLTAEEIQQQYAFLLAATAVVPALSISQATGEITLSWSAPANGFILETSGDLSTSSWVPLGASPLADNASLTLPLDSGSRFFRLRKP
jgi:Concanavalin A-like lectin/glucanases superfamily